MDWGEGHYLQLSIAMGIGLVVFAFAGLAPKRTVIWLLLLLIPFQFIDSKYGSINLVLTFTVGAAFLIRGHFKSLPLLGPVAFIMLAYTLSFTQIPRGTALDHGLYMLVVVSNFLLFYLVYNYVRSSGDFREMWRILATINVLVLIYGVLEMAAGTSGIRLFGLSEFEIRSGRADRGYLNGAFGAIGMSAEYMAIQSLVALYAVMHASAGRGRSFWLILLTGNLAFMIASGSRGGIVAFFIGLAVFLVLFRKDVPFKKMVTWGAIGGLAFVASAYVITQYTPYNILFDKLEATEFDSGVPDSRQGWFKIWDRVIEKPIIGHGPRLRLMRDDSRVSLREPPMPFPHNAYMYLIYTIGIVGLVGYLWFFSSLARQFWRGGRGRPSDPLLAGLPVLGIALLVVFASSQMRMEMFRFYLHDYQQYVFMLMAAFLAFSHLAVQNEAKKNIAADGVEKRQGKMGVILSRPSAAKARP